METSFKKTIFLPTHLFITLFLVISYWVGVVLYDFIDSKLNFSYVDELLVLFLCLFVCTLYLPKRPKIPKGFACFIIVAVFYFFYSLVIQSNIPVAIISDCLVFVKPFLAYFVIQTLSAKIGNKCKVFLGINAVFGAAILPFLYDFFPHPSRFATAVVATAFLFLYSSRFSFKSLFTFLFILSLGLLSQRAKMYGFFMVSSMMGLLLYSNKNSLVCNSFKKCIILCSLFLAALVVSYQKIYFYFYVGLFERYQIFARPISYLASLKIACDYFPFGSGFGSFGTYFSGKYYSALYYNYGLSGIQGLTPDKPNFIADTFFPSVLGQFGIIGFLIFLYSGYRVLSRAYFVYKTNIYMVKNFYMVVSVLVFFTIESLVDSTFTHNRGMFMLLILSLLVVEMNASFSKRPIDKAINRVDCCK